MIRTGRPRSTQAFSWSPQTAVACASLLSSPWPSTKCARSGGMGVGPDPLMRMVRVCGGSLLIRVCTARPKASKTKSKMAMVPPAAIADWREINGELGSAEEVI